MKRRRRLFTSVILRSMMEGWAYGGDVIPPGTVVVAKQNFAERYGTEHLRVAYYSLVFGLNSVFLMDGNDRQRADITQKEFRERFEIVELADEDDDFQYRTPKAERLWASARGE